MIKTSVIATIIVLIFATSSFARESTEKLADRLLEGQKAFEILKQQRDSGITRIMNSGTLSSKGKQKAIRNLQEGFLKNSRKIHIKYREPFVQRIIQETNAKLPDANKIKRGLGSDIYLRDTTTGKVIKDAKGRKILNSKHRGWQGDLDLGGDPRAVEKLNKSFNSHGVNLSSNTMNAPGFKDFKEVEVTINVEGRMDKPGSSGHLTQTQMDAFSKETYVSVGMKKNQAGKKLVETNDHVKKAIKGLNSDAAFLVSAKGEGALQGMSKGTLKSIDSGGVKQTQLNKILDEVGYKGGTDNFTKQLQDLKGGHLAPGVGLDKKNAEAFKAGCKKVTQQAVANSKKVAALEIKTKKIKIEKLKKLANSPDTPDHLAKKYKKLSKYYQEEVADSKVKMKQSALANQEKLKGGNYDTFYERNSGKTPKGAPAIIQKPALPKTSRINAIKKGLKPDLMSVAGYGMSAYLIYDTWQKRQKGKITQNEATIEIAGELVDTGFGVVVDVGTASVVTGAAVTGAVGTIAVMAAPMVVTAGTGYLVTEATKEGLKLVAALRNEDISTRIADAKVQEAVNTFKLEVNELMKLGVTTGDWRYFSKADDIVSKLANMYTVTKDETINQATIILFDQVDNVKGFLEEKYGVSIYAVKEKVENERGEAQKEAMLKAGQGEIAFGEMQTQNIHSGHVKAGDTLSFTVQRLGSWDEKHTVEWLVNGESFKKKPAANGKANRLTMGSQYFDSGQYTVAVRAMDNATGKIIAHAATRFTLKGTDVAPIEQTKDDVQKEQVTSPSGAANSDDTSSNQNEQGLGVPDPLDKDLAGGQKPYKKTAANSDDPCRNDSNPNFTGQIKNYRPGPGRTLRYTSDVVNCEEHGFKTWYYKDGSIVQKATFRHGKQNGLEHRFDKNGKMEHEKNYLDGKEISWKDYWEDGTLSRTGQRKNGKNIGVHMSLSKEETYLERSTTTYNNNGTEISDIIEKWFNDGRSKKEEWGPDDKWLESIRFDKNGKCESRHTPGMVEHDPFQKCDAKKECSGQQAPTLATPANLQGNGQKITAGDGNSSNPETGKKDPKKQTTSKCITGSEDDLPLIKNKIDHLLSEQRQVRQEMNLFLEKAKTKATETRQGVKRVNGWIKLSKSDQAQVRAGTMSEETYRKNWIETGKWQAVKKDRQEVGKLRELSLKLEGQYNKKRLRYNEIARKLKQVSVFLKNKKCAEMKSVLDI